MVLQTRLRPLRFEAGSTSAACTEVREKLTRLGVPSSKKPTVVHSACGISTTDNDLTGEKLVHLPYATGGLSFASPDGKSDLLGLSMPANEHHRYTSSPSQTDPPTDSL